MSRGGRQDVIKTAIPPPKPDCFGVSHEIHWAARTQAQITADSRADATSQSHRHDSFPFRRLFVELRNSERFLRLVGSNARWAQLHPSVGASQAEGHYPESTSPVWRQ